MSATGDGSSKYLTTVGTVSGPINYSYAFWYYPLHLPATGGGVSNVLSLTSSGAYEIDFIWDHTLSTYYRAAVHINSNALPPTVLNMPTAPPINQWIHIGVTFDGTTLSMYLNGRLLTSSGVNGAPNPSQGDPNIWILGAKGPQFYMDGSIGDVGVWSVCLSAGEVLSLFTGTSPTTVQAGSQLFFDPLNTGVATPVGPTLTNHGATIDSTKFAGAYGGIKEGGSLMTTKATYTHTFTGGIKLGGSMNPSYIYTMTGGFKYGGSALDAHARYHLPFTGGLKLGGSFMAAAHYNVAMTGGLKMGGTEFQLSHLTDGNAFVVADDRAPAFTSK